jgi:hypothetical protein
MSSFITSPPPFPPPDGKVVLGHFDWVLDYCDFSFIFDHTRIENPSAARALVIGCGTSDLSHKLLSHYGVIVSVDNDADVIAYMADSTSHIERLKWIAYDMIECYYNPPSANPQLQDHSFDILVDKCSMDAMLVGM